MNHQAYIQHVLRVGGWCICVRCDRYRARVSEELHPPTPEAAARHNASALVRLGVFRSIVDKFNKEL